MQNNNNNQRSNHHHPNNSTGLVVTSSSSSSSLSSNNSNHNNNNNNNNNNNQAKVHHPKAGPSSTTTTTKSIGKMFLPTQQKSNPHRIMKIVVPQSKNTSTTEQRPLSPTAAFHTTSTKAFRHTSSFDRKLLQSPPPPTNLPTSSSTAPHVAHQTTQTLYGNKKALSSPVLRHVQPPPPPPPIHNHSSSAMNKPLSLPPQVVLKLQPLTSTSSTSTINTNANQNINTSQTLILANHNTSTTKTLATSPRLLSTISAQNVVTKPVTTTAPHCEATLTNQNNNIKNNFSTAVRTSTKSPQSMPSNVLPSPGSLVKPQTPQSNSHIILRMDSNTNPPPLSLPPSKMATTDNFLPANSANSNTTCDSKNILPNNAFYNKNIKGPPKKQQQQHHHQQQQQQFQPSSPVLSRPRSNSVPNHTGSAYQPLLSSSSPSTTANTSSLPHTKPGITTNQLRRGKWTVEEEAYVARVIQDFNSGYLNAPAGTTLRTYLSDKLNCDPMRITKKFTGDSCIGKRVFHPAVRCSNNAPLIDKAQVNCYRKAISKLFFKLYFITLKCISLVSYLN